MTCRHIWKLTGLAGGGLHTQYECELCEQLTWITLGQPPQASSPPPLTIVKERPATLDRW